VEANTVNQSPYLITLSNKPNTVFQGLYKRSREPLRLLLPFLSVTFTVPSFLILHYALEILPLFALTTTSWSTWNANWTVMVIAAASTNLNVTPNSTPLPTTVITKLRNAVEVFVLGTWPSKTWFMVISFDSLCLIRTLSFPLSLRIVLTS